MYLCIVFSELEYCQSAAVVKPGSSSRFTTVKLPAVGAGVSQLSQQPSTRCQYVYCHQTAIEPLSSLSPKA